VYALTHSNNCVLNHFTYGFKWKFPVPFAYVSVEWCLVLRDSKKGKAVSQHTYGGAGGEEVQLLLIHDLGIRWGEWSVPRPGRALPTGKRPPVPTGQETGWAPEPVWTQRREEKSLASAGD
jgi:hypothetical protein